MTPKEALQLFKDHKYMTDFSWQDEMSEVAIDALEKAEKYAWHDLRKNPEDLPSERDSIFAKYYGTEKWHTSFFRKVSDEVMVCFLAQTGERIIKQVQSHDGIFKFPYPNLDNMRAIAWRYIEPFEEDNE